MILFLHIGFSSDIPCNPPPGEPEAEPAQWERSVRSSLFRCSVTTPRNDHQPCDEMIPEDITPRIEPPQSGMDPPAVRAGLMHEKTHSFRFGLSGSELRRPASHAGLTVLCRSMSCYYPIRRRLWEL